MLADSLSSWRASREYCDQSLDNISTSIWLAVLNLPCQPLYDITFSPDCQHVAFVGRQGVLRVCHFGEAREVFEASSYFGALYCVAWSPDGQYLITGGQDDLVSVWSLAECDIVARAEGHSSWVMCIAFDPYLSDATAGMNYRFGSVGQDARLLLWDFSGRTLSIPKPVPLQPSTPKAVAVRLCACNCKHASRTRHPPVKLDVKLDCRPACTYKLSVWCRTRF